MNEVNRTCRNIDWLINTMHVMRGHVYTWNHGVHHLSYCQYVLLVYELFWTRACPEGMGTNGTRVPCELSSLPNPTTRKSWAHYRALRPLLFSNGDVGSFTSYKNKSLKVLWDGIYGFSSLSEKTRKSFADVITKAALSSQLFKDPECWSGRGLNLPPPARRTGALPTELTRRRFFKWRYDRPSGHSNLSNCELTWKKFRDFNGIRTRITRIEVICNTVLGNSRH